jgi:hypothetical protein
MPVRKESVKDRLERDYLYHYGKMDKNCVLCGSFPRQGDASKWYDYSPYGNHGTITGATWERLPSGLWVNSFDGTDDIVDCLTPENLTFTTESFSILAWLYSDTVTGSHYILSKGAYDASGYAVTLQDAILRFWNFHEPANYDMANYFTISTWTFLGITRNGTSVKIYKNGVQFGVTQVLAGDFTTGVLHFVLGGPSGAGERWDGYQCVQRVLNGIELSATQIAGIFNSERHLFGV